MTARPAAPFSRWEWILAARYLRSKRKQGGVATTSIISFFCILLAVAVLTVTMAVFNGFRTELLDRLLGYQGHAFIQGSPLTDSNREATLKQVRTVPGVVRVTSYVNSVVLLTANGHSNVALVRGMSAADVRSTPIVANNIRMGSLKDFGEGEFGGNLVLIGSGIADSFGLIPGDSVTLTSPNGASTPFGSAPAIKTFTVGGVFSVGVAEVDNQAVFMPLEQAQLFLNRPGEVDVIEVMTENPDHLDRILPAVRKVLGPKIPVLDWRDTSNTYWGALQTERMMVRLILIMLVVIAAMTIISGVVMLVKNKERDIAILRTMGAGKGSMMRVFIIAGASIGVVAVPFGVGIAVLFCHFIGPIQHFLEWLFHTRLFPADVYQLDALPAVIDWREVAWTCGGTMILSVLVTIFPSWKAARVDPVEALRYE